MRVLIAPDKFKGTLTARQAAEAMAAGVRRACPDAEIDLCPMSDGGEGFVDVLAETAGGRRVTRTVTGPLPGMRVDAEFAVLPGDVAVIEMSSAAGLTLVPEGQRNPLHTTTFGVGELIRYAAAMECRQIVLGLGGSATCDAGIGCLQALGCPITLRDGRKVTAIDPPLCGRDLDKVKHVGRPAALDGLAIDVACDVTNPLYGPDGAAYVFASQKGASPADVAQLDGGLRAFAEAVYWNQLPPHTISTWQDPDMLEGAGAAGGIGWSLVVLLEAEMSHGAEVIGRHNGFENRVTYVDFVITGEGRVDATSERGKVVGYVDYTTHIYTGNPLVCVCGSAAENVALFGGTIISLAERFGDRAMTDAAACVEAATADAVREVIRFA